jgi:hypothetical protein
VAVKLLPASAADDPVFEEWFRRVAEAAAGLNDPHAQVVLPFGELDSPEGLAIDGAGNVYVPFTDLMNLMRIAVDAAGNVCGTSPRRQADQPVKSSGPWPMAPLAYHHRER